MKKHIRIEDLEGVLVEMANENVVFSDDLVSRTLFRTFHTELTVIYDTSDRTFQLVLWIGGGLGSDEVLRSWQLASGSLTEILERYPEALVCSVRADRVFSEDVAAAARSLAESVLGCLPGAKEREGDRTGRW